MENIDNAAIQFSEQFLNILPVIPDSKNYWLFRTSGGKYYDEFVDGDFIAIAWNKITAHDLRLDVDQLTDVIAHHYPKDSRPKRTANQLLNFANSMKVGDTVLIPSTKSSKISFGEIIEDEVYSEQAAEDSKEGCTYIKRKRVRWIKEVNKNRLDPYLYSLLNSHHTISNAKEYSEFIDRTIYSFYVKGDEAHLVLEVTQEGKIHAKDLFKLGNYILNDLVNDFNETTNNHIDTYDIEAKVNVQSPGKIVFIGKIALVTIVGMLIVGAIGGGFSIHTKEWNVDLKTDKGIITQIIEYQDHKHQREQQSKVLNDLLDKLEVKTPEELETIMSSVSRIDLSDGIQKTEITKDESKETNEVNKNDHK